MGEQQRTVVPPGSDAILPDGVPWILAAACQCQDCKTARIGAARRLVAERDRFQRRADELQEIRRALEEGASRLRKELELAKLAAPPRPAWGPSGPSAEQYRGGRAVPVQVDAVGVAETADHTEITLYLRR